MVEIKQSHEQMVTMVIAHHFNQTPKCIMRIAIGICNEVYRVSLDKNDVIVRLSAVDKFLMGSHDHIPKFKALGIKVPNILFEDYNKKMIPLSYQIQNKISWTCENGIQFNQNTQPIVDKEKEKNDKKIIKQIVAELDNEV